jgi:hypothetical protein
MDGEMMVLPSHPSMPRCNAPISISYNKQQVMVISNRSQMPVTAAVKPLAVKLLAALCATLPLISGNIAQAETSTAPAIAQRIPTGSVNFTPPRGDAPRETRGAASRGGSCQTSDSKCFALLMPLQAAGRTLSERPTFMAYIPADTAPEAMFTLEDEAGNVRYRTRVAVPTQGGVIQVKLPDTAPALELDKTYKWGIVLRVGGQIRADSPNISSYIKRVAPAASLPAHLSTPSLEQAAFFGENGLWYDTLATLAELRKQQPQDQTVLASWNKVLEAAELSAIASEPLVN